ncbi:MAG: class I SAM-dependent methyltransferase [Actinobacteria bacterium]|nr:class I SAM-dependent methyltransferase [Actinomycetota bacterium]
MTAYRRADCRLCHSTALELALRLEPTPLADAYVPPEKAADPQPVYPIDMYLCADCGLLQLLDVVPPQEIYVEYIYESASSLGLDRHFDEYAQEVLDRIGPVEGSLVVDIGSNDGMLLRSFQARGMSVLGVDPAVELAKRVTASGIETIPDFLTVDLARRIREERGPAALVTANNVIANIDDLDSVVAAIRELLAAAGVFVFESFYLGDLVTNKVFDFLYHEHLSAFSVKPVEQFFRRHGMELIDVLRVPTKGGSLRYTVQLEGGGRPVGASVGELEAQEAAQGLHGLELFRAFASEIDSAKRATLELVRQLKSEGASIAAYGASATTTTLVYHFELGDFIDYFVDDYAVKQGLLSPGLHIPVLPSQELYARKPDYVVVTAWRYYEPITRKHQRYHEQGGRFIVPMPELKQL